MSEVIAASEVDQLEWLATEALWSTAKSPFDAQRYRWVAYSKPTDQLSAPRLIVDGNLQRYRDAMNMAVALGDSPESPNPEFLSQAAEHLGKTAGALIGVHVHFVMPEELAKSPLEATIPAHIAVTDLTIRTSSLFGETTLPEDYHQILTTVTAAMAEYKQRRRFSTRQRLLNTAADAANNAAATATNTWASLLSKHPEIQIAPGATLEPGQDYLEDLRADFEAHIPAIREAVAAYRDQ